MAIHMPAGEHTHPASGKHLVRQPGPNSGGYKCRNEDRQSSQQETEGAAEKVTTDDGQEKHERKARQTRHQAQGGMSKAYWETRAMPTAPKQKRAIRRSRRSEREVMVVAR